MYRLPLGDLVNTLVDWLYMHYGYIFDGISLGIGKAVLILKQSLAGLPWWFVIILCIILVWHFGSWKLAVGTGLGLLLVYDLQLWASFLDTLVLVLVSTTFSVALGVPLGIYSAHSPRFCRASKLILDFMQTMPSFVYLIPALILFGLGIVPAVFATIIFAMPPAIRFTDLGIRQVPRETLEVGMAFGASKRQLLWEIELPGALPTIVAGVNQTMMLSLSMVVIAGMIGAGGFGQGVLAGISQMDIGKGFENGLAVVIMAMILSRLSQSFLQRVQSHDR